MTSSRTFRPNTGNIAERKIRDEAILLPISNAAGELGTVYDLNVTATAIWELARQGLTEGAIVDRLLEGRDVAREAVERDVRDILDHLLKLRMLIPA
ncbi:MAG: PqqD family protein [Kiritimatiellia bacterium]